MYACSWPVYVGFKFGEASLDYDGFAAACNLWRTFNDIEASFDSIRGIVNYYRTANYSAGNYFGSRGEDIGKPAVNYAAFQAGTRPGGFNDADMILVGGTGLSVAQSELQMALWAVWSAPLMLSVDLGSVDPAYKRILQNKEVLAVNQDDSVAQGTCVTNFVPSWARGPPGCGGGACDHGQGDTIQVWMKPLADKSVAVAMVNMGTFGHPWVVNFTSTQLAAQGFGDARRFHVRDLFKGVGEGTHVGSYAAPIQTSSVKFVKVSAVL